MEKTNDLFGCEVLIKQYFSAFLNICEELLECIDVMYSLNNTFLHS